ncbi:MAG TPA: DUF456 domain-containing protein [Chitinophagaceae bacterium]|nr:DUF456 domain-containing protein [Chitinophagaceae bacterium]
MDWLWASLGILLCLVAILGSILPLIPGPPIAYVGLLLQQLRDPNPFTTKFLLIWAAVVVLVLLLDYVIPLWGTRRFGGTKYGVWGCTIGFIAAFWMGPFGVIVGPFLGAFVGELIGGQTTHRSFRAALGSFVGFLMGSFLKLVASFLMMFYIIRSL